MAGKEGLKVRGEHTDRAYASGTIGFFERWAQKKALKIKLADHGRKKGPKGE